jgi:pimeloyl-ACP methyl ester carboxylesterase
MCFRGIHFKKLSGERVLGVAGKIVYNLEAEGAIDLCERSVLIMNSRILQALLAVSSALLLSHCGGVHVEEKNTPIRDIGLKDSSQLSKSTVDLFKGTERLIEVARDQERRRPEYAIGLYLEAAHLAWRSRDEAMLPLYNHAVGQAADLIVEHRLVAGRTYSGVEQSYQVVLDTSDPLTFPAREIDDLIPVDCLERNGIRSEVSQEGVGAPMVALHGSRTFQQNPFISPMGGDYNLTATVDFSQSGKAVFRLYDVTKVHEAEFWGKKQALNVNLTASYYVSAQRKTAGAGANRLVGVFRPAKYSDRMGMYLEPRFDPNKIPLILVHGLVSSPMTWVDPMNEVLADPLVRKHYQIYTYYYPTGFPVRMTGSKLKRDLIRLQEYLRANGAADKAENMVIFGHSMGGLITSMNVRDVDESTWGLIANKPIDQMRFTKQMTDDYKTIFEQDQVEGLRRAVFIATPHRGSNMANAWYGGFISLLIDVPSRLVQLDLVGMTQSMTDLGRTVFNQDGPVNSMMTLKAGNPALDFMEKVPIRSGVRFHSIVGDRGKGDTPDSSDGVVPYWSSHIEGVDSELVVPSGHSAHHDPAAIPEMQRILRLHLGKE